MKENKTISQTNKIEDFCHQNCIARNVERNSSEGRKIIKVRNSHLHKDKKSVRDGLNEDKIKYLIDLIEFKQI